MPKFKALPILAGAAALGLAFAGTPASATITSTLNTLDTGTGNFLSGDFGTVTINLVPNSGNCNTSDAGCALVTFHGDNGYTFLDSSIANLNTTASVTTFEPITPTLGGTFGSQNVDHLGNFALTTACTGSCAANQPYTDISYYIDGSFTTESQILAFNSSGFDASAHVLGPSCAGSQTCFVGEAVPAPIIGHGLLVLLAIGGVLGGSKLLENRKKLNLQAA